LYFSVLFYLDSYTFGPKQVFNVVMKAIIQRVTKASVSVDGEVVGCINNGLCVLLGIARTDTAKDAEYMVRKILNLRLFDDDAGGRWKKSVKDKDYEVLCVSQFTLQCVLKGNKPDFHHAMGGVDSEPFYEEMLKDLAKNYDQEKIKAGKFGAHMQVHIDNDGPVTIELNSPQPKPPVAAQKEKTKNEEKKEE